MICITINYRLKKISIFVIKIEFLVQGISHFSLHSTFHNLS